MAGSFVKVFGSILASSVWSESEATRVVWITMLVMADAEGNVWGAVPGIARIAGVSLEAAEAALDKLCGPDPHSRTPDHDGRRLLPVDGGWYVVNARKYREMQTDGQRRASARSKRYRDKKAGRVTERDGRDESLESQRVRTEGESEPEREERTDNGLRAAARPRRRKPIKAGLDKNDSTEAREVIKLRYEILGGDPTPTAPKLKAASRALAAGFTVDKLRQVFQAILDAGDDRSMAAFCASKNTSFEYSVRPDTAQKILDELLTPKAALVVQHPNAPRHTFTTRADRDREAVSTFLSRKKA